MAPAPSLRLQLRDLSNIFSLVCEFRVCHFTSMQQLFPALLSLLAVPAALAASEITIDFSISNGLIRPLHGVNMGPLCYRGMVDLSDFHRQLKLPLTRLHDVVWVNYDAVDVSTIFRESRNDSALPDSYDFAATDDYIASIVNTGSPIIYRLGESIEHTPRKYRVHPPQDFAKWADICLHIIDHYNQGWANGFRHDIRYWEIWNEPENQPAMWTGTDEEYFQLYEVAAKAIKQRWPDLKVGGPSLGYTGEFVGDEFKPGGFLLHFLHRCREQHLPLDFLSWHCYAKEPSELARRAAAIRRVLDEQGFAKTESHLNEWNYLPNDDWRPLMKDGQGLLREQWSAEVTGPKGAAYAAWALMALQDAPLDAANFYTAEIQMFGMFNIHGSPHKNFYAFKAFRNLIDTPKRIKTPPCRPGSIAVCAGVNQENTRAAVLLSNFNTQIDDTGLTPSQLPWRGPTQYDLYLVDADHDLQLVEHGALQPNGRLLINELKPPAVVLVNFSPQ